MNGETVVRLRGEQTGVDRYDNPVLEYVETPIEGAAYDPGGSREPATPERDAVVTNPKLYFTYSPDIVATDRMRVRGVVHEVVSRPAVWVSPFTGRTAGLVVELGLVEG